MPAVPPQAYLLPCVVDCRTIATIKEPALIAGFPGKIAGVS
jgi:hypothetical protein